MLLLKQLPRIAFHLSFKQVSINTFVIPTSICHATAYATMTKPKVYLTREINEEALEVLKETCDVSQWSGSGPVPRDELLANIADKEGLFCLLSDKIDKEVLDKANKLKVLGTMSVGYDHLDVDELKKRKIRIGYTPGVLTDATAELTVALLLATSRRLIEASEEAKNGGWSSWSPFWMCGPGLADSTVGIVGFGRIGQAVARMLKPFNVCRILYQNRCGREQIAQKIGAERVGLQDLLELSDFVIVTVALTPDTEHMFNDKTFKMMKNTAVFINTSRGGIVDQEALIRALENRIIWGAGLDVTTPEPIPLDSRLLQLKNCVVLPHIGSASLQTRKTMAMLTVKNVIAGLKDEEMPAELL